MKWNPADYAKNSEAQLGWARELISRLRLQEAESILDVGCGDGRVTAELAESAPKGYVLGVDSSPECIAYASEHYPTRRFPRLEFRQMDARQLQIERPFDLVFSNAALHWVDDHPAFLRGCSRLLRPGGRLVISCGGQGNAAAMVRELEGMIHSPRWREYFHGFTFPYFFYARRDYERWLPESGLKASRLELVEKDMIHKGAPGLAGWIRTTWMPYTNRIPEPLRDLFVDEVVARYLEVRPPDDSGRCHVGMVRLEVEAFKEA